LGEHGKAENITIY